MPLMQLDASQLYITAPDCPPILRGGTLRRCGSTGAEVQIQYAVDMLRALNMGGVVKLSPGTFVIDAPIKLYAGIHLEGSGMYTTQLVLNGAKYCDMVQHFGEYAYTGTASAGAAATITVPETFTLNELAGKYLSIYGGTGAGQRRAVISNTTDGVITISSGDTPWNVNPDETSKYRVGPTQQLFMGVRDMTLNGNIANNAAFTSTASEAGGACTLKSTAAMTVGRYNDKATIEILDGAGAWQIRRIISNTADTITVDGPWVVIPNTGAAFSIGGSGIAMYGPSAYDLMLTHIWTSFCTHHGAYFEETWGHCYDDFISEFNGLDGLRTSLAPHQRAVTSGAWGATTSVTASSTGAVPTTGPKMNLCKLVANLRHGVHLGSYTYNACIAGNEVAGGGTGAYGVYVQSTALENSICGNRVVSSDGTSAGGFYIASTGNAITGNVIKSGSGVAALSYGINLVASGNVVAGNLINMPAGVPINDDDGRNTIEANRIIGAAVQAFRVRGRGSWVKGAGDYITINPGLATGGAAPVGNSIVVLVQPADTQTRSAGTWTVDDDAAPTAAAVKMDCGTALTAATTTAEAIAGSTPTPETITLTSAAGLAVGGMIRVASGGVGSAQEDVRITGIASDDITGVFTKPHDSGVAVTPLWTFYYDIGYNDRGNVAT